ncbi:MAG: hypothetical protein ABI472_15810 [Ginsengibacter sp.]
MTVLDAKKTYNNLLSKGFKLGKGDHKFLEFYYKGKYILQTKISHGEKELEEFHIGMMKRQCKLEKSEFLDLANCPLSVDDYIDILKRNGTISPLDFNNEELKNNPTTKKKPISKR